MNTSNVARYEVEFLHTLSVTSKAVQRINRAKADIECFLQLIFLEFFNAKTTSFITKGERWRGALANQPDMFTYAVRVGRPGVFDLSYRV